MGRGIHRVAFVAIASLVVGAATAGSAFAASYTFLNLAVPGATYTSAMDINSLGQIVGHYGDAQYAQHAFSYVGGSFTTLDVPGSASTFPAGVNDAGVIVGSYSTSGGFTGPYLFDGASFLPLDLPPNSRAEPIDINGSGQIVGFGYYTGVQRHGYVQSGGAFTIIDLPGFPETVALGINDAGQVAGLGVAMNTPRGFIYSAGVFSPFELPWEGASLNWLRINNAGDIAGNYFDSASMAHGFVYSDGVFTSVDVPDAAWTQLWGFNDQGQLVGSASDGVNVFGFLATPVPEASSLSLTALALALGFALRR